MDPVPIDYRNNSCDEILATTSKLTTIFINAAGLYDDLAPTFTIFHESCMAFAEPVRAIQSWLTDGPEKQLLYSAPWYQLTRSLGRAEKAISVLQDEVESVLRSRYESRSRSDIVTEWNLEGLQSYGEDVQHENENLKQILQYMKLLSISDTASISTARAEDHHAVEGLGPRRATLPVMANGSQADTMNTLEKPAPPYRLVDVRTNETHTQWYVEQSVGTVDEATPFGLVASNFAAREDNFKNAEALLPNVPILPTPHANMSENEPELLACPSCGHCKKEAEMFRHFNQHHPGQKCTLHNVLNIYNSDKQLLVFVRLTGVRSRWFQVDNRDVTFYTQWPWDHTADFEFSVRFLTEDYVLDPEEELTQELKTSIEVLYSLLRRIRPNFDWDDDSEVKHVFVKIDTLWKLCMSGDFGSPKSLQIFQVRATIQWLLALASGLNSIANELRLSADLSMPTPALVFATKVQRKYFTELDELISHLASSHLLLRARPAKV